MVGDSTRYLKTIDPLDETVFSTIPKLEDPHEML